MVRVAALLFGCALFAAGQLSVINAVIEQTEGGSPLPAGFEHVPGETFFYSFQVQGYRANPQDRIQLRYKIEVLDPAGIAVVRPFERTLEAELAPQDKEWRPKVRQEIALPALAPSGTFKIAVQVTDEVAKTTATHATAFIVKGRSVPPSDTLVLRNFGFFRSEEATQPLAKPAYRPGDAVWARFDITGYKFGPGNGIDVAYGIAVLNAEGRQLWAQPEAAVERSESFYPKPYVPGSMGLNLQPNIRPGEYAIVVTVTDAIGGQKFEEKYTFTVE